LCASSLFDGKTLQIDRIRRREHSAHRESLPFAVELDRAGRRFARDPPLASQTSRGGEINPQSDAGIVRAAVRGSTQAA